MLGQAARYEKGPLRRSLFHQAEQGGFLEEGSRNGALRNGIGELIDKGGEPAPGWHLCGHAAVCPQSVRVTSERGGRWHRTEVRGFFCRQTWATPQLCTPALASPLGTQALGALLILHITGDSPCLPPSQAGWDLAQSTDMNRHTQNAREWEMHVALTAAPHRGVFWGAS